MVIVKSPRFPLKVLPVILYCVLFVSSLVHFSFKIDPIDRIDVPPCW